MRKASLRYHSRLNENAILLKGLYFLLALCLCLSDTVVAQSELQLGPTPDWVDPMEISVETARADASDRGGRCVLFDNQVRVGDRTEHYTRFLQTFLSAENLQSDSQYSIDYQPAFQKLVIHSAKIHRAGDVFDILDLAQWRTIQRETDLERQLFDGTLTAVFFPKGLRVGDTLEVSYALIGAHPTLEGRYSAALDLQHRLPIQQLHIRILWSKERKLYFKTHGVSDLQPQIAQEGAFTEYTWKSENVPAYKPSSSIPFWFFESPWLQISDFESWAEVAEWSRRHYKPGATSPELKEVAQRIASASATEEERIAHALRFTRDEIRYFGIELGVDSIVPTPPGEVLKRRFGDCKDKTWLLIQLLELLDVRAYPALVHTYLGRGIEAFLPTPWGFNHVIAYLPRKGADLWLDPTDSYARGRLDRRVPPPFERGLILRENSNGLTTIPIEKGASKSQVVRTWKHLGVGERAHLDIVTTYEHFDADLVRAQIASVTEEEFDKRCTDFTRHYYPSLVTRSPIDIYDDPALNRIVINEVYAVPELWSPDSNDLCANFYALEIASWIPDPEREERQVPYAIPYPAHIDSRVHLEIGPDWEIDAETTAIENDAFRFLFSVTPSSSSIELHYVYESKKDHVPKEDYSTFVEDAEKANNCLNYYLAQEAEPDAAFYPSLLKISLGLLGAFCVAAVMVVLVFAIRVQLGPDPLASRENLGWIACVTILSHPRLTLRRALERSRPRGAMLISALAGVVFFWEISAVRSLGDDLSIPVLFGSSLLAGPLTGLIRLVAGGALLLLAGRMVYVRTSFRQSAIATGYAQLFYLWIAPTWIPVFLFVAEQVFTSDGSGLEASTLDLSLLLGLLGLQLFLKLWFVLILLIAASEVHSITLARAFVSYVLAYVGVVIVLLVLIITLGVLDMAPGFSLAL